MSIGTGTQGTEQSTRLRSDKLALNTLNHGFRETRVAVHTIGLQKPFQQLMWIVTQVYRYDAAL